MRGPGPQARRSRCPRPDSLVERDGAGRDVGVHALDHAALKRDHAAALVLGKREGGDDRPGVRDLLRRRREDLVCGADLAWVDEGLAVEAEVAARFAFGPEPGLVGKPVEDAVEDVEL